VSAINERLPYWRNIISPYCIAVQTFDSVMLGNEMKGRAKMDITLIKPQSVFSLGNRCLLLARNASVVDEF